MAGHSKWKNIRIRKGKQDAIRGKLFTKLGREIIVATRMGGADPSTNARLRLAIEKAKENSVPKDNIERAIARGSGEVEGEMFEELMFEGIGPGGVGVLVETYSENRNRTVADIRHAFSKSGGNLTENGSVSWQFKNVGQIRVPASATDEETLTLMALDNGAEDVSLDGDHYVVQTPIESLHICNEALVSSGLQTSDVGLTWVTVNEATPSREELVQLLRLLDHLDDLDDVKETYINVEIPEEILQEA